MAKAKSPRSTSPTTRFQRAASVPAEGNKVNANHDSLQDAIRARAYELYEERGRQDGYDQEDWFRAEVEVVGQHSKRSA